MRNLWILLFVVVNLSSEPTFALGTTQCESLFRPNNGPLFTAATERLQTAIREEREQAAELLTILRSGRLNQNSWRVIDPVFVSAFEESFWFFARMGLRDFETLGAARARQRFSGLLRNIGGFSNKQVSLITGITMEHLRFVLTSLDGEKSFRADLVFTSLDDNRIFLVPK